MTAGQPVLSDALLNRALRELAAGPEADVLITDVLRTAATTPQKGRLTWPMLALRRSAILVVVAALLLAVLAASLFVFGQMQTRPLPTPAPRGQSSIVIQRWNGLRGEGNATSQTVFGPGSATGVPLTLQIPSNAVSLRWSPDGLHLVYFTREAPVGLFSLAETGVFVANADGSDPLPVQVEKPVGSHASNGWWDGAVWAPTGGLFALPWGDSGCSGADCLPPSGIEVFDSHGVRVNGFDTPENTLPRVAWSPDSAFIGWTSGSCVGGSCGDDAFHSQPATAPDGPVTTVPLKWGSQVSWSPGNRLLVQEGPRRDGVYSIAPDGSDRVDIRWPYTAFGLWSPDGKRLAAHDSDHDRIVIREVVTGVEVYVDSSAAYGIGAWSPESDRLVLYGDTSTPNAGQGFLVVNVDGSGLQAQGDGDDFGWMPAAAQ